MKNWEYSKINKYSNPQRVNMFPNEYRIKNYTTKRWIKIYKVDGGWHFKGNKFPNMTILKQWLDVENHMYRFKNIKRQQEG